jgi:hypothetical protein
MAWAWTPGAKRVTLPESVDSAGMRRSGCTPDVACPHDSEGRQSSTASSVSVVSVRFMVLPYCVRVRAVVTPLTWVSISPIWGAPTAAPLT